MDKLNEKRTQPLGKVKPSLNKKLMDYCKLIGVQKIELLEELINKELEGKVLEDTFIISEKPFYFNLKELIDKGTVEASTNKPSSDLYNQIIIKKIPNNLDNFEEKLNTYCYDNNSKLHRGIINFSYKSEETDEVKTRTVNKNVNTIFLLFDYTLATSGRNIDGEQPSLKISVISFNELPVLLDNNSDLDIKNKFEKIKQDLVFDSMKGILTNSTLWKYNNNDVINYFHLERNIYHIYNILKAGFTCSSEYIEEPLKLLDNLVYRTVDLFVENKTLVNKVYYLDKLSDIGEVIPESKSIDEVFKEAVIELNLFKEVKKYSNSKPVKVYDVFTNPKVDFFDNKYESEYPGLIYYIDSILEPNEEANVYSFVHAFPHNTDLFKEYEHIIHQYQIN